MTFSSAEREREREREMDMVLWREECRATHALMIVILKTLSKRASAFKT